MLPESETSLWQSWQLSSRTAFADSTGEAADTLPAAARKNAVTPNVAGLILIADPDIPA
jgi:hypothetical protein